MVVIVGNNGGYGRNGYGRNCYMDMVVMVIWLYWCIKLFI